MGVWGTLSLAVFVAVSSGAKKQEGLWSTSDTLEGVLFPPSEDFIHNLEKWWGTPHERAAQGLPEILFPESEDEMGTEKKSIVEVVGGVYLPSTDPSIVTNEQCRKDVESIYKVLEDDSLQETLFIMAHYWFAYLPDSWGVIPDGMMYGNYMSWGMMEECTMLHVHELIRNESSPWNVILNTTFNGKYCLISDRVSVVRETDDFEEEEEDDERVVAPIGPLIKSNLSPFSFQYGTCMPSTCTTEDLRVSVDETLRPFKRKSAIVDCQTEDQQREPDAADISFMLIVSILGFLVLSGAIVDICINYWNAQDYRKGPLRYLLAFSGYTNLSKIFTINNNENPEVISCLHGIRVLSMVWVVWGHSYILMLPVAMNIIGSAHLADKWIDQTVVNGSFSVDTFFFMSGLLVAYGCLKEFSRVGHVNWIMYYVHRIIRLTPPILITAGALATVARFFMVGPYGLEVEKHAVGGCRDWWWRDVLYITNFNRRGICLPHCWYTAVDTQIYLFLPLVLVPLLYKPKIGLVWLAMVTVASFAVPLVIFAVYHTYPMLQFAQLPHPPDNVDSYGTPWCRASAYLIGVWAGWILHHMRKKRINMRVWQALLGWALAIALGLLLVYGVYDYNTRNPDVMKPLTKTVSIIYGGLSRGAWAVALLWVVVACHAGYGGPINTFLSHPSWQPLSRLTYTIYLTSVPLQYTYMGMVYMPLYMNHLNKIMETCGYLFISGLLSVLLSLLSEGPVLGLEKILIKRPGRGP